MSDGIRFRPASLSDLPTLLAFEQGVISAERPLTMVLKEGEIHYYDIAELINAENCHLLVAEYCDSTEESAKDAAPSLVASGYIKVIESKPYHKSEKYGYIGFIYVDPDHRGKALSQQVIKRLCEWAKAQDITDIRLEVFADNTPAVKAYEKLGFKANLVEMTLNLDD